MNIEKQRQQIPNRMPKVFAWKMPTAKLAMLNFSKKSAERFSRAFLLFGAIFIVPREKIAGHNDPLRETVSPQG